MQIIHMLTCSHTHSVRVDSGISLSAIREAADALQLPHAYSDLLNNHVLWCMAGAILCVCARVSVRNGVARCWGC